MTHRSLDLTAFRFENDSPAAAHHPKAVQAPPEIPLEDVSWAMIGVFSVVIALAGTGLAAVLFTLAEMGGR